jgi:hypothetical protein
MSDGHVVGLPDWEIRIFKQDREVGMAGVFFGEGDAVDIGMGAAEDIDPGFLSELLGICQAAFSVTETWYEKSALESNPSVTEEIKKGTIS